MSDVDKAVEILNKLKEQNKARANRYYEKNKEKISIKRQQVRVSKKKKTLEQIIQTLTERDVPKDTTKLYIDNAKRLSTILNITDFMTAFHNASDVIEKINNATKTTGDKGLYSINSKKAMYQSIMKLNDIASLNIPKEDYDQYLKQFDILKLDSKKQTKVRTEDEKVMDFDEYLDIVKNHFGSESKEYLIAELYNFRGFRDDLQFKIAKEATDDVNYIIPGKRVYTIVLNTYKTHKKYGSFIIKLPIALSKLIKDYISRNKLEFGDYLFKNKLSRFIVLFNKKLNLPITINTLRQMRISKYHNKRELTSEEEVDLAREMHHSVSSSAGYKRNITQE